jgi:hypothetical protein
MSQTLRINLENETDIAQAQAVAAFCDDTTVVAEFATGESFIVNADGTLKPMTTSPAQKPKATKPKAATPTKKPKRKSKKKPNGFIEFKGRCNVWKACKPKNLIGMSLNEAIRLGVANHDGTVTAYGKKVGKRKKPQRSWNL